MKLLVNAIMSGFHRSGHFADHDLQNDDHAKKLILRKHF